VTAKATNSADDGDDGVLRIGESAEEPKYDVLFRIRGKEYQGIANPSGALLFKYLDIQRNRGTDTALSWLLEKMLAADAYTAITTDDSLSRTDFNKVCDLVRGLVFGREKGPKPQGPNQRRTAG
jgi:hypothetical protein